MSAFHVREANARDTLGMAKVRVNTWRSAYRGIVHDDFLEKMSYQSTAENWERFFHEDRDRKVAVFVAEDTLGEIIGIAVCGPEGSHDPVYHGEVYVLYVLPPYQNQGIGRALIAACVQHLVQQLHVKTMLIWVLAENPYRRFYESIGGKATREKTREIGGQLLLEVGYGWEEITPLQEYQTNNKENAAP